MINNPIIGNLFYSNIYVGGFAILSNPHTLGAKIIMVNNYNYLLRCYYVSRTMLST